MDAKYLFDQVVDLTSIRDIESLEFSLLRILHRYLNPLDLRMFKTDVDNKLHSELTYNGGKCKVIHEDHEISDEIKKIIEHMNKTDASEYTQKTDSGYLTIYIIHKMHFTTLFLQVLNHEEVLGEDKHLLTSLLNIYRNYIGLFVENITDSLTGLLNRKSFDRVFDKFHEIIREDATEDINSDDRRKKSVNKYWLLMLDIDHFKLINDRFGHLYGDDVLILLSKIIKNSFRNDDFIFRFGGEEFVLIIKCEDVSGAKCALERLLKNVASYLFPQVGRVTISAGAVCMSHQLFSETLLDYADQALYYSKENGRNQVAFFEEMVEKGLTKEQKIEAGEVDIF